MNSCLGLSFTIGSLADSIVTRLHFKQFCNLQNVDFGIKLRRLLPQRPAPLASVDPAHAIAPLTFSWDVLYLHKI